MVDRIAAAMRPLVDRLLIVSSHEGAGRYVDGAVAIADEKPGAGPLAAIATALRAARTHVLVVAWDMPYVELDVLEPLVSVDDRFDGSVWETEAGIEPLCACYAPSALPIIDAAVASGARRARDVAYLLRLRRLPYAAECHERNPFISMNTPDALADAAAAGPTSRAASTAEKRG